MVTYTNTYSNGMDRFCCLRTSSGRYQVGWEGWVGDVSAEWVQGGGSVESMCKISYQLNKYLVTNPPPNYILKQKLVCIGTGPYFYFVCMDKA